MFVSVGLWAHAFWNQTYQFPRKWWLYVPWYQWGVRALNRLVFPSCHQHLVCKGSSFPPDAWLRWSWSYPEDDLATLIKWQVFGCAENKDYERGARCILQFLLEIYSEARFCHWDFRSFPSLTWISFCSFTLQGRGMSICLLTSTLLPPGLR